MPIEHHGRPIWTYWIAFVTNIKISYITVLFFLVHQVNLCMLTQEIIYLVIFSFIYTRLKYIYNCQNVRLTSSDAIMAYAFIQVQDVTERTIAGMEVTKLIAQVRYNIILKRTTLTFNIFGYDFGVKCIYFHYILPQHLHAPGWLQRVTTMCCDAMMVPIAMA